MSELERIYTVPLGRAWVAQKYRRAEKAMMVLKKFTERHMKPTEIIIDQSVNKAIWARGIRNPPRKIRVRMTRDSEGVVTVNLAEAEQ
ncbi:MAG: 50S ribosomal protein L31e [Candidatus Bathyarchaeota archaeon]|nr:50S ribosomal protein L31e [Candidatus Bathyarchaeota archaeon]